MEIELCGYKVLIDPEDYEKIVNYNWRIIKRKDSVVYFHTAVYDAQLYREKKIKSKTVLLHRLIMNCSYKDGKMIDHINRNTLDCRKINLRFATNSQNQWNRKTQKRNVTKLKGVMFDKRRGKYYSRIVHDKKAVFLGYFTDMYLAHEAYCIASVKYHGAYGRVE